MTLIHKIFNKISGPKEIPKPKLPFKHVDFFYWKPLSGDLNFGDHLSWVIVTKILADQGYVLEEETTKNARLLALGSVLHFANDQDTIWGTGLNGKISLDLHQYQNLDVRAVRGPLTRDFLIGRGIEAPEIYGDPALLLPHIFPGRFQRKSLRPYSIVPNLHDLKIVKQKEWSPIISPLDSWNSCVEQILESDFIIASSLHGLIIAEAYGIPARYLRLSEEENLFKYNDYMMGTGRGEIEFATSPEEALEMGGMAPPNFDHRKLLDAFPSDLWK